MGGDHRDREMLSSLMDQGGGLAREWDHGGRKILPSWEKDLGKEDRDTQHKRPVFQFARAFLSLLKKARVFT